MIFADINPVMIAVDGLIGQMMEPVDLDLEILKENFQKNLGKTGTYGKDPCEC